MCSTGRQQRQWCLSVNDMIKFAEKVQSYTKEVNQTTFVTYSHTFDATLRKLELISDAQPPIS